jgi:UDP-N-acetylglucosamine--N-acetylmuramyl-(pentapeptide) pyrophosphoryl-undecaprenol N-acetylglucosamine transferase
MISGGGTGGHIFPAISIAQEIKSRFPDCRILFVGAKGKMEMDKVPQAGFEIKGLPIAGIQRNISLGNFLLPFKLVYSVLFSIILILKNKPQVVIGVGGYASGPLLIAAAVLGRRMVIQEQNSFPGITNRFLSARASLICVAYPGMEKFFPKSVIRITGNPVRKNLLETSLIEKEKAWSFFGIPKDKKVLFVTGGSLGAKSVNEAIATFLPLLTAHKLFLIWQTGKPFFPTAQKLITDEIKSHVFVTDFLTEMNLAYACADVVVSRAGAGAISEIAIVGLPSVLVPYPYAAEDHQTHNAKALADAGAAVLVPDRNVKSDLQDILLKLLVDDKNLTEMKARLSAFARPSATIDIVNAIEQVVS